LHEGREYVFQVPHGALITECLEMLDTFKGYVYQLGETQAKNEPLKDTKEEDEEARLQ